jgi:DNA topoisomerase I
VAQYLATLKERKAARTKEEKAAEKAEKKKIDDKYGWALLDGRKEKVRCACVSLSLSL